ncbi:hypothetical protein M9H77_26811 [Catharanthus roseus]|uniref:Uncharacterized protein n=1 Tax=Catharanthus roseus TaxID=4058 RepID=A0ACC0AAS0_CATRO|nr:hypothetical protein M9H77_26811 [Catharanthus roseus]
MGIDVRTKDGKHGRYVSINTLSVGHVPRKLAGNRTSPLPHNFNNLHRIQVKWKKVRKMSAHRKNKNKFEEGDPEKENENFVESHESHKEGRQEREIDDIKESEGINLLTYETNFVLVDDSLYMQE